MKASLNWIKEYVDFDDTPRGYSEKMTMSGSKVEGYEYLGAEIENVVIGKIISLSKHPDADRLTVCSVDIGDKQIQIVTGATNLKEGDIVPAALDGSTLAGGKKISSGKLRGVLSEGMLCSLSELGLSKSNFPYAIDDGIFVIEEDVKLGDDIVNALGLNDYVVEFEITSNRADCLSVVGLARETAATYNKKLVLPNIKSPVGKGSISDFLKVSVASPDLCPRYMARVVSNVKIEPSPKWLRERLWACGVRPINNIVDITNYVMLEYGQPMHAFDYSCVSGSEIVVRNAGEGEIITTLDGQQRPLTKETFVIADCKKPIAIAGIMGGENSEIKDNTQVVVFESANFHPASVRKTAVRLGLRTESSSRFEKGLDPALCATALDRACELVELIGAGEVVQGTVDIKSKAEEPVKIKLDSKYINSFLGTDISESEMVRILKSLEFNVKDGFVIAPSFRGDIEYLADIAEEIARIYGYDNIPLTTDLSGGTFGLLTKEQKVRKRVSQVLMSCGYFEVVTYSFISPKHYDKINLPQESPLRNCVKIRNPLGEDTGVMRTTALPSILDILAKNYNHRNDNVRIFELATIYNKSASEDELPDEKLSITFGQYGKTDSFYTLKGAVEALLSVFKITDYEVIPKSDDPSFHPGRTAELYVKGEYAGIFGQVHPAVVQNFSIDSPVYAAALDFNTLYKNQGADPVYKPLPKFPATTRDISIICDEGITVAEIERIISKRGGEYLVQLSLFDVYTGEQIAKGKKSVAYSLMFRSEAETLKDETVDRLMQSIYDGLKETLGAQLR